MTNPHEDNARARKVIALLLVVPTGKTQMENDMVALFLEGLTPQQRGVYEVLAGVKACSSVTWGMVITAVRARHVPGDGGAIDRQTDVRRPDFTDTVRKAHRAHYVRQEGQRCVPCEVMLDVLNHTFDAGVTAAIRAVGL